MTSSISLLLAHVRCKTHTLGGTYSPGDGSASPLLTAHAFCARAAECGAEFRFRERVTGIIRRHGRVVGVRTDKGGYATKLVINAAGPWARAVAQMCGLDVPVMPDSHEAGITEPVERFLEPMVVDIRPAAAHRIGAIVGIDRTPCRADGAAARDRTWAERARGPILNALLATADTGSRGRHAGSHRRRHHRRGGQEGSNDLFHGVAPSKFISPWLK